MKSKKTSKKLSTKLNLGEWISLLPSYGNTTSANEVSVAFSKSHKHSTEVNRIRVKIGLNIANHFKWKLGDRFCFYVNPDDKLHFLIVKSDSGIGYKLTGTEKCAPSLTVKWDTHLTKFALKVASAFIVDHQIHEQYLSFRAVPKGSE